MVAKAFLFLFALFGCYAEVWAQEFPARYEWGGSYLSGFIIKHDREMGHLSKGITRGAELSMIRKSYGRTAWQRRTGYPDVGLSLSYFQYPTPVLDKSFALNGFSDYYLISLRRFSSFFRLGVGLGYHTNPYHKDRNNKNVVYGSPVTVSLQSQLGLRYRITDSWAITGTAGITHFSVGAMSRPNKGLNIASVYVGLRYLTGNGGEKIPFSEPDKLYSRKLHLVVNVNGAGVNYNVTDHRLYPAYSLSAQLQKPVSSLFDIQIGLDFFNNTALKEVIKYDTRVEAEQRPDHKKAGVSGGVEYHMNRISVQANVGYYFYQPYLHLSKVYQRYGLKFYPAICIAGVDNKVFIYTGFKSHGAVAENMEFGIGYRF